MHDIGHYLLFSRPGDDHVQEHSKLPALKLLAQQNAPKRRPAIKNADVCECCHLRPGVDFYDRRWCCEECGLAIYDDRAAEASKPVPPKKKGKNGK
jgi:hypothetical protein